MSSVRSNFADRHIGPDSGQINSMLTALGEENFSEFIKKVVPENIALTEAIAKSLPSAASEVAAIEELRELASENRVVK